MATSYRRLNAMRGAGSSQGSEESADASVHALNASLARDHGAWLELAARAGVEFPDLLYDWHTAWAATTSSRSIADARIIRVLDRSGALLGLLPFCIAERSIGPVPIRQLEWPIGDLACPDHLDVPVLSTAAATDLVRVLDDVEWEVLRLESLAAEAPGAQRLAAALAQQGYRVEWGTGPVCPYLALPSSWEAYLGALSPSRRQTIRRKERALFREHDTTLVDYAPDRLEEGWEHLLRLHHQQRPDSAFGSNAAELQRAFAAALASRGRVWLTTLDVSGRPVAAWYGFAAGDTMCFYQSGRDREWEHASVGQVLMGMMIRRAIEHGFRVFDFLRGDERYKMTWTSTFRCDRVLVAYRRNVRGALAWRGEALMRAARRAKRALAVRRPAGALT